MGFGLRPNRRPTVRRASYDAVRPLLRTGDILVTSGEGLMSSAIRRFSGSWASHVGVIVQFADLDRVVVVEALSQGVVARRLSQAYAAEGAYAGHVYVGRLDPPPRFAGIDEKILTRTLIDLLDRPYDRREILRIAERITLGVGADWRDDHALICSEVVAKAFDAAGWSFAFDRRGFIAPSNIVECPHVKGIARLR